MCYCLGKCSCAENRYDYLVASGILDGPPISVNPPDPKKILPEELVKFATVTEKE
jgi:hypothetical protein